MRALLKKQSGLAVVMLLTMAAAIVTVIHFGLHPVQAGTIAVVAVWCEGAVAVVIALRRDSKESSEFYAKRIAEIDRKIALHNWSDQHN